MNNMNYLLIGVILVIVIYFNYKIKSIEKMSNTSPEDIRQVVKEVYKADVIALKNIGDVAASLLSPDKKKLTLPFDEIEMIGDLNVKKNITFADKLGLLQDNKADGANIHLDNVNKNRGISLYSLYGKTSSRVFLNDKDGNLKTDINNGDLDVKGDIKFTGGNNWILHTPDDKRTSLYLAPSKVYNNQSWDFEKGFNLNKGSFDARNGEVKTSNLYTESIGKHKGDGWLRINNIGNSASVALYGTMSINEYRGKGGLNVGSWNKAGVGNGKIYSTGEVDGNNIKGRSDVTTGNISLKNHRHDYGKNRFVGGFNGNKTDTRQTGRSRT